MKTRNYFTAFGVLFLGLTLFITGCTGNGSSGTTAGASGAAPSFNVKGSSQLIALSNTVAPFSKPASVNIFSRLFGPDETFTYQIVNQGLSNDEVLARLKGKAANSVSPASAVTPLLKGTNLLAIDSTGRATMAIKADYLVKVMYSVTDPKGEYVYLALDTGFITPDGNDYSQFIAANNCAFYRVKIADNSYSCVQEGVYVQPIDEGYLQRVSSNQKPIQFDADGNMYFPGTKFNARCDEKGVCTMVPADWKPRIYRAAAGTGTVVALTQDNQLISYYLTLPTGELAFQTIAQDGSITLYLWQPSLSSYIINGTTTNLTGNSVAIDFFTVDNYNTIMWGGWTEGAIRFAKPGSGGLVQKASLDTSILAPQLTSFNGGAYAPRRIAVGDDGKLYALFSHTDAEQQQDQTNKYFSYLRIYQVLPYSAVVKAEMKVETSPQQAFNWNLIGAQTPFQVGGGYIFYKEAREKIGYGVNDVIQMVSLKDRSKTTLLGGTNDWWEIYSWRLKGDRLYFAALDLATTTVYSGEIDIAYVKNNPLANPDLFVFKRAVASAVGASSKVQDIEGLQPLPVFAGVATPIVRKFHQSSENLYSASVEFSNLMNQANAENNVAMTEVDGTGNVVNNTATLKLWIANFLHLIPDLDVNNATVPLRNDDALLDLKHTTPLKYSTRYRIAANRTGTDAAGGTVLTTTVTGTQLALNYITIFATRPQFGWYIGDDTTDTSLYVGKYAGGDPSTGAREEYYALNTVKTMVSPSVLVPPDFRLEFSAANQSYYGLGVVLYDDTNDPNYRFFGGYGPTSTGGGAWLNLVPWGRSGWMGTSSSCGASCVSLSYGEFADIRDDLVFNGEMKRYRLDVFSDNVRFYKENPPGSGIFEFVRYEYYDNALGWTTTSNWSLIPIIPRAAGHRYRLFFQTPDQASLTVDNITVTELDSSGNPGALIQDIDFESGTVLSGTKNSNIPNFSTMVSTSTGSSPLFCDTPNCPGLDIFYAY